MGLLPGQVARIALNANTLKDALAVPTQAIVISPTGAALSMLWIKTIK
jgi:membrane fusion protein, multidrug efflux system